VKRPRKFTVLIERDEEGYYVASVPSLKGCHTQAKNLDTLMKRVHEVVELCLEDRPREGDSARTDRHSANLGMTRLPRISGKDTIAP
jgi:predicted RNase H-like HicB family nuclease